MNSLTDQQLLRDYAERKSDAAFAELVRRHVDHVYSTALRLVRDAHLAQDVTQGAFVALAQNARQLMDRPILSGWLHLTARNLAANIVRSEVRRRTREQEAVAMNQLLANESDAPWETIAPQLDAALGELNEAERDVITLRYFERKSAREMAHVLGTSEEAAQKRVNRAVEHLREGFSRRNLAIGAAGLVTLISANAVQSAPLGLAATISAAAILSVTAASTSTLVATTKTIALTTLQKSLIIAGLAAVAGTGIYATYRNSRFHDEIQALQQQQVPLTAQLQELQSERDEAMSRLAGLESENGQLTSMSNEAEILRLRKKVGQLKAAENQRKNDPIGSAASDWLDRVKTLKDYLARHPEEKIPELKYSTDKDWLDASDMEFKNTNALENAVQSMRFSAQTDVGQSVLKALSEYSRANNGQFPGNLSELQPYCDPDIENLLEQLYEIAPSSIVHDTVTNSRSSGVTVRYDIPQNALGQWVITRKVRVNPTSTTRFAFFLYGFATWQSPPGTDNSQ